MSRMYLFCHCHSPGLRSVIAALSTHTWMQIWLNGDQFPSLLQIVKIVSQPPFSKKKLLAPWPVLPPGHMTNRPIRQVRLRETSLKRCPSQEAPWTIRYSK